MNSKETHIEASKRGWYNPDGQPTPEQLRLGCLQRIAAATETMAKDREDLQRQRDYFKDQHAVQIRHREHAERRLAATQGVVTKLKKRIAELEGRS